MSVPVAPRVLRAVAFHFLEQDLLEHLPDYLRPRGGARPAASAKTVEEFEAELIRSALARPLLWGADISASACQRPKRPASIELSGVSSRALCARFCLRWM